MDQRVRMEGLGPGRKSGRRRGRGGIVLAIGEERERRSADNDFSASHKSTVLSF